MDIEELIASAHLPQQTATLCLRADLVSQWDKLHAEWRLAEDTGGSLATGTPKQALAAQMRALTDEMQRHQVQFVFEALPPVDYSALIAKHPPVGDDKARLRWNEDAFRPALITACLIEPKMTEEQIGRLLGKLSSGQQRLLWQAALIANEGEGDIPFDGAVYAESLDSGMP